MTVSDFITAAGDAAGKVLGGLNKGPSAAELVNAANANANARAAADAGKWTPWIIGGIALAGLALVLGLIFRRS